MMTKITWVGEMVDDIYLFNSEIDGGEKYNKKMKFFVKELARIRTANEGIYEEMIGENHFMHNECIDEEEIEDFLLNCCYGNPKVMKEAKRDYEMGYDGYVKVDGKIILDYSESGKHFINETHCCLAPNYGHYRGNRTDKELDKYGATIFQSELYDMDFDDEGKYEFGCEFELEIDGEFDIEKLLWDEKTCRVTYDGKQFKLVERSKRTLGKLTTPYVQYCWGNERDEETLENIIDENGNEVMRYYAEKVPTDDCQWESWEFYDEEEED